MIDADIGMQCKRPFDGYYNGDLARSTVGVCYNWHDLFAVERPAANLPLNDISAFIGDHNWEDIGDKCR